MLGDQRTSTVLRDKRRSAPPRAERLRVLMCLEALGVGGKERQAVELIKGLAARSDVECRVVCLAPHDFYLDRLVGPGTAVDFVTRRVRWDASLFYRLFQIVRQFRPDLIHTNGLMSSFYSIPLARLMSTPLINGSIRNAFSGGGVRWRLERMLARMSDYRVANSYAGLQSRGLAEAEARNVVIYNGFDFSRVAGIETTQEWTRGSEWHDRVKIIGMVAEFNRFKDYPTFIQMARILSARRRDVAFLAVGGGTTLQASKELAAGLPTMTFLGEQKNIEPIVGTFDVGVLSTFTEGISNSIMEYMALGKPVVATDGGGTRELVVEGHTGFLVPPRDPNTLAARVEYLLDNPDIARGMGEAGEARLRRTFSLSRMIEETIRLYQTAVTTSRYAGKGEGSSHHGVEQ